MVCEAYGDLPVMMHQLRPAVAWLALSRIMMTWTVVMLLCRKMLTCARVFELILQRVKYGVANWVSRLNQGEGAVGESTWFGGSWKGSKQRKRPLRNQLVVPNIKKESCEDRELKDEKALISTKVGLPKFKGGHACSSKAGVNEQVANLKYLWGSWLQMERIEDNVSEIAYCCEGANCSTRSTKSILCQSSPGSAYCTRADEVYNL